jgi:tetratricopeptide (TPR) repeat protein
MAKQTGKTRPLATAEKVMVVDQSSIPAGVRMSTASLSLLLFGWSFVSLSVGPDGDKKPPPSGSEEVLVEGPRRTPDGYLLGWTEYTSEHFLVDSDLLASTVHDLIEKLETLRAKELRALIEPSVVLQGRVRVIASRASALRRVALDKYFVSSGNHCRSLKISCRQLYDSAMTMNPNPDSTDLCGSELFSEGNYFVSRLGEPTIVIPLSGINIPVFGPNIKSEVVAHQIAHYLAAYLFPNAPHWLVEGFAGFLQTIGGVELENVPPTGTHIRRGPPFVSGAVGLAAPGFVAALCRDWAPVSELLVWNGQESVNRPGRYHATSWLLYHWLWNRRSKQLTDFQGRLGSGESSAIAWRAAFPEFIPDSPKSLDSLDSALEEYRDRGFRQSIYYRPKVHAEFSYSQAPLRPSDVHMLLVDALFLTRPSNNESAAWLRAELHNVLLEEPGHPWAAAWWAELDGNSALPRLRKATERWPADWRAWFLLGRASGEAVEKETAYRTAVKLNPDSALPLRQLALLLATTGRAPDALPFIQRALKLAPWDAEATATLSAVDAALGRCEEAQQEHRRAVSLSKGGRPEPLAEVERLCAVARE